MRSLKTNSDWIFANITRRFCQTIPERSDFKDVGFTFKKSINSLQLIFIAWCSVKRLGLLRNLGRKHLNNPLLGTLRVRHSNPYIILKIQWFKMPEDISWIVAVFWVLNSCLDVHYTDVIKSAMASQITNVSIVFSTVCRSKKTSKLRVTGLCEGNSPLTGVFPAQMASNEENGSIWWRHHAIRGAPNIPHCFVCYLDYNIFTLTIHSQKKVLACCFCNIAWNEKLAKSFFQCCFSGLYKRSTFQWMNVSHWAINHIP